MIGVRASVVLLSLALTLLPATAGADPTDETPAGAQLDPDYAAGRSAIEAKSSVARCGELPGPDEP